MATSPSITEKSVFCFSWLSNANSGKTGSISQLQALASSNINKGLAGIQSLTGNFGSAPVWGPVITCSPDSDNNYVTDNLMYVVKGANPMDSSKTMYVVAIAGTNAISNYGWFGEDFAVNKQVACLGGNISQGAFNGVSKLLAMQDTTKPLAQQTLIGFLTNELLHAANPASIEIAVTGHSLGGALSPVIAYTLQSTFNKVYPSVTFSAYPSAGPTPGDQNFATSFGNAITAANFHSFINYNDAVPRAWVPATMNPIASLYTSSNVNFTGFASCSGGTNLPQNNIVQGMVQWALSLIPSNGYARLGTDSVFNGVASDMRSATTADGTKLCTSLEEKAAGLYADLVSELRKYLKGINDNMNGGTFSESVIMAFFTFMYEVGYQHTTAYVNYFLSDYPQVVTALHNAVSGAGNDKEANTDALDNLDEVLGDVYNYLVGQSVTVS